jgi:hypothetical protein
MNMAKEGIMSLSGIHELLLRGLTGEADASSLGYISRDSARAGMLDRTGH